jgi:hypothetical protein
MQIAIRLSSIAMSTLALALASGCAGPQPEAGMPAGGSPVLETAQPSVDMQVRESALFDSLTAMTAGSDLVIRGRVTRIERGRTIEADKVDSFTFRSVYVEVDDVLRGTTPSGSPKEVLIEEEGWTAEGVGYSLNGSKWAQTGDEAIFFLTFKEENATYRLVNSQGRLFIRPGGELIANSVDPHEVPSYIARLTDENVAGAESLIRKAASNL